LHPSTTLIGSASSSTSAYTDLHFYYRQRPARALINAQSAGGTFKRRGQVIVIKHTITQTLADADKATHTAFLIKEHHAVRGFFKRHRGAHIHTYTALVADRYAIAALTIGADPNGALFPILRLVPGLRAKLFTTPATRTPGGFGHQLFQTERPFLSVGTV